MTDTKQRKQFSPGHYPDLPNDEYHGSAGYGSTTLKKLLEMPYSKMDYQRRHPKPASDAMNLGTALHTMALEPEKVESEIFTLPSDLNLRTKADRARRDQLLEENSGKLILSAADFIKAQAMAESLRNHPQVSLYLENGYAEHSIYYWYNPEDWDNERDYRIMCKVRPDWVIPGHHVLFDLKTAKNAAYTEFMRSIKSFNYHMSAAMYLDGANRCEAFKEFMGVERFTKFVWICVENEPPYEVACYEISADDYDQGLQRYHSAMRRLWEYNKSTWKGYGEFDGEQVQPITRPSDVPTWGTPIV